MPAHTCTLRLKAVTVHIFPTRFLIGKLGSGTNTDSRPFGIPAVTQKSVHNAHITVFLVLVK